MGKKLSIAITLLAPYFAYAAGEVTYTLSSPIPGGGTGQQQISGADSLVQYIKFLFPFMLSIAAISALVMFITGGVQYALGGASPEQMKGARERISNAIWGLLLAVFSVLILQTINPELVKLDLKLDNAGQSVNTAGPTGNGGGGGNLPIGAQCASGLDCLSHFCDVPPDQPAAEGAKCMESGLAAGAPCTYPGQCASGDCRQTTFSLRPYCQ